MTMHDLHEYPWSIYLIHFAEDIFIFLGLKVIHSDISCMFSCSRNAQVPFVEKPKIENKVVQNSKHCYLIHTWSDKSLCKGALVNRALASFLIEGHLKLSVKSL